MTTRPITILFAAFLILGCGSTGGAVAVSGLFELLPHLVGLLPGCLELGGHVLQALPALCALRRLLVLVHIDHEGRLLPLGLRLGG